MHMSLSKLWKVLKDREAWHTAVDGVEKSWIQLINWTPMWHIYCGFPRHLNPQIYSSWLSFYVAQKDTGKTVHPNSDTRRKLWIHILHKIGRGLSSVQSLSHVQLFVTPWKQHTRLSCPSPTLRACSNSCPLSQWCYPTISSTVNPVSSCLQSFTASGSFPMSQFFASGGQNIGVSASASVLPMNIQDWFPLGWTDLIPLQSKGLSRVFSNTTVQKHQFFSTQLCL